jgi:hypothetical protein
LADGWPVVFRVSYMAFHFLSWGDARIFIYLLPEEIGHCTTKPIPRNMRPPHLHLKHGIVWTSFI